MATEKQLKFIADIEAAVTAMKLDRNPVNVKITEIFEMTGRESHNLRPLIVRLAEQGDLDQLKRLQAAFARVGVKQAKLEREIGILEGTVEPDQNDCESEPGELRLEPKLPPHPEKSIQANGNRSPVQSDRKTLDRVLEILEPLPKASQAKVISSAAVYLGVGE